MSNVNNLYEATTETVRGIMGGGSGPVEFARVAPVQHRGQDAVHHTADAHRSSAPDQGTVDRTADETTHRRMGLRGRVPYLCVPRPLANSL